MVWGLGYPARVTRSILFAGAGGALGRPSRPERRGCVWGYKAACLRLDATARRAGAGRGGREAWAGCFRVIAARPSVPGKQVQTDTLTRTHTHTHTHTRKQPAAWWWWWWGGV